MKIIAVIVAAVFLIGAMPVLAADSEKEKSLFQKASDSIQEGKAPLKPSPVMQQERHKVRPILKKVTFFQWLSDSIKEGSAKAREKSARTEK